MRLPGVAAQTIDGGRATPVAFDFTYVVVWEWFAEDIRPPPTLGSTDNVRSHHRHIQMAIRRRCGFFQKIRIAHHLQIGEIIERSQAKVG